MRIVAESRSFNSVNIVNSIREELESSAPVGSSASTMAGFVTIALAAAKHSRCFNQPEERKQHECSHQHTNQGKDSIFFYSAILQRSRFYFEKPRFLHYFRTETNFEAKNEDCISWKAKIED